MVIGLVAGLFGGGGLMLFYQALSQGNMGLTAAIGGVLSAAVPVIFNLLTEGLPKPRQLAGFALALVAIWIIAAAVDAPGDAIAPRQIKRSLWMGIIAGTCFGIYFVLLKEAVLGLGRHGETQSALSGVIWSITFSRLASTVMASLVCAWIVLRQRPPRAGGTSVWNSRTLLLAAAIGLLDMGGNLLYTLAARLGRMDVAAVLSSLYPAVTIVLAVWILKERTSQKQAFGMILAVAAVGLISM